MLFSPRLSLSIVKKVTGPVSVLAILTPRGAYTLPSLSYLSFTLESSEAFEDKVPCPRTQHLDAMLN